MIDDIKKRAPGFQPKVAVVLGSGLGGLADELSDVVAIPFADLPGWPPATAPGHAGRLLFGRLGSIPVVVLQGRMHLYEGNHPGLVVQPVLLFKRLGARVVILTNAAGGLNPEWGPGALMVIRDHLNLTGLNPLLGQAGYEPLTLGMAAALPYCDDFMPVHNVDSLAAFGHHLLTVSS